MHLIHYTINDQLVGVKVKESLHKTQGIKKLVKWQKTITEQLQTLGNEFEC